MLILKCPKHPRYTGDRSPRAACQICIALWNLRIKAERDRIAIVQRTRKLQGTESEGE